VRERSLKQKLIIRNTTTLSVVFVIFLVVLAYLNWDHYTDQNERLEGQLREELENKGKMLVLDKHISMPDDIEYNRFGKIPDILKENAEYQEEIVFGGFVDTELSPWAWVEAVGTGSDRELTVKDIDRDSEIPQRVDEPYTRWALKLENQGLKEFDGVIVFAAPIYVKPDPFEHPEGELAGPDKAGVILYGLTTEMMYAELEQARQRFMSNLMYTVSILGLFGLVGLGFAIFVTQRQATTITQPLEALTEAADFIAAGNYDVTDRVRNIASDDEIQMLSSSFIQMVEQVDRANQELRELNRHLEDKVEERTKQLRESESKFRTLFEESADAILVSTADHFLDCNQAMLDMMGVEDKHHFLSLSPEHIVPEQMSDGEPGTSQFDPTFSEGADRPSRQFEWVNRRADGTLFPSETVVTTFTLNGERVLHMVLRDITERRETEEKLKVTQQKLVETAHSAGMAEIATGVLHNIGNILNSVNISTEEISGTLKSSKLKGFLKANQIVGENLDKIGYFFTEHPKGKLIPGYYISLGDAMKDEHRIMTEEIVALADKVSMMRDVISTQQNYAKATLYTEDVLISEIVEDALKLQLASLRKQGVKIVKSYDESLRGSVPKVKLVHVLTNLIKNGKEAMFDNDKHNKPQVLEIAMNDLGGDTVEVRICDNGCGIEPDNLEKIFNHGFTTKTQGHGFGLHTCANFMTEMGGTLYAESSGLDHGSCFIVRFPLVCRGPKRVEETIDSVSN